MCSAVVVLFNVYSSMAVPSLKFLDQIYSLRSVHKSVHWLTKLSQGVAKVSDWSSIVAPVN